MSSRSSFKRACAVAAGLWIAAVALAAAQEPGVFESIQQEIRAVFEKSCPAVVRIEAMDDQGALAGTGFFVDPNGTLYTSYTVGGESREIVVCNGELKYPATRVVADARCGIAILKVEARTPFLALGASRELRVTTPVMTVGHPMDLPLTPSFGMVGGFDRKYLGRYFVTTHIRANLPVQRGQGGAPLLNMRGEAVGILISSLDQGSATFALPIEAAEKVRRDFMRFGEVRPGWIGIDVGAAPEPVSGSSARVHSVLPEMPAAKAGLRSGDVLLQVGETKIASPEDVIDASFFMTAEDEVHLKIARGDEELDLSVEPIHYPSAGRPSSPVLGSANDLRAAPAMQIDR